VGDAEGVVVVPQEIAEAVAAEAEAQTLFEDFVTEQVLAGRGIFGLYPPTDPATGEQFKAWCASRGERP
jgi:regulator of RNase E activity RraA